LLQFHLGSVLLWLFLRFLLVEKFEAFPSTYMFYKDIFFCFQSSLKSRVMSHWLGFNAMGRSL
jgi:hypothetical protein